MKNKFSCCFVGIGLLFGVLPVLAGSPKTPDTSVSKEQRLDFRKSIGPKVGVAGGGCEVGTSSRMFTADEECQNIKNKVSGRWNQNNNQLLKESLGDKSITCVLSLNGAGSIIGLKMRQSSHSAQLDQDILEFLRKLSNFQINKTWELKSHEYLVEFPEISVKHLVL